MSENVNVTLNLNELFSAYNKEDFMKKVFKEFLKENPSLIMDYLKEVILREVVQTGHIEEIKSGVSVSVKEILEKENVFKSYEFIHEINKTIYQAIADNKKQLESKVVSVIGKKEFQENVSQVVMDHVKSFVEGGLKKAAYED